MARDRAWRRAQDRRRFNQVYNVVRRWHYAGPVDSHMQARKLRDNLKMCSCSGCGHVRAHNGPTMQERRIALDDQIDSE